MLVGSPARHPFTLTVDSATKRVVANAINVDNVDGAARSDFFPKFDGLHFRRGKVVPFERWRPRRTPPKWMTVGNGCSALGRMVNRHPEEENDGNGMPRGCDMREARR